MSETPGSLGGPGLQPSRRLVLRGAAVSAAALLVAACSGGGDGRAASPSNSSGPSSAAPSTTAIDEDVALVTRAIADEESLLTFSATAVRRFPADRAVLGGVVDVQREHVSRLRASLSNLHPPVTHTSARVPRHIDDLKTALAALEAQEHRDRAANCLAATSGLLAQLFASIAASHAVTVAMLTPDAAPSGVLTPDSVTNPAALQPALEAEYAAVFGYGVVGGVLTAGVSHSDAADEARSSYDAHRGRRDRLRALITAAGAQPAAAEPAYDLPFPVTGQASAARLARYLEARCAAVYARAVAATVGDTRALVSTTLVDCATRGAGWGAAPTAFPGLDET